MLKLMIILNGGQSELALSNFTIGKTLHVPSMGEDKVTVIDADVARCFFYTELYYAELLKQVDETLSKLDDALSDPDIRAYLSEESRDRVREALSAPKIEAPPANPEE